MKTLFVRDLLRGSRLEGNSISLLCWVKSRRDQGQVVFLDLCDSTGCIQAVAGGETVAAFTIAKEIPVESAVRAMGLLQHGPHGYEIRLSSLQVVGLADRDFSPRPRSNIDVLDGQMTDHILRNRHLYLRNEKLAAILKFRHMLMGAIHDWFRVRGFIEITAPVLTSVPLYEDGTAMSLNVHDERVFLTQCVGFYLESAVHSFEKVYNMGPSFRAEESRSKRHLMEYWHIKAELAWVDIEDLIGIVEDIIRFTTDFCQRECQDLFKAIGTKFCTHGLTSPFPRISYAEAVERLQQLGVSFNFGDSLSSAEEEMLSKQFISPFWIVGIPRKIEPFPYVVDGDDPRVTKTADLIASGGYGELLGIAEKIHNLEQLDERMREKNKYGDPRYEWLRQLRQYGCVPHGGFGMGFERYIRWLLQIEHVRDTIPFPRIFRRKIAP